MNKRVKLLFAGDFCSKPSTTNITADSDLIAIIKDCDHAIINYEVPLRPDIELPKQERERFFQNDDAPHFLREIGFDLFSIANNHIFDWNEEGFLKTKLILGNDSFGAGTYDEAYKVKVIETNGIKIGFLAVTFAAYKGVFDDVSKHEGLGCAYINDLKVNHVILEAKKNVNYLFVLPHDGIEYIDVPLPETIARYRDFIDYGADGVIGSHPHCPQGWEEYKGKPIFYSLGNFFFNSKISIDFKCQKPHWYEGRCVILSIEEGRVSWEVINTRNIENRKLTIDKSEEAVHHNLRICKYLEDTQLYNDYFTPIAHIIYSDMMSRIDQTCHKANIKHSIKSLIKCLKRILGGIPDPSNSNLVTMYKHDMYRFIMKRMIN